MLVANDRCEARPLDTVPQFALSSFAMTQRIALLSLLAIAITGAAFGDACPPMTPWNTFIAFNGTASACNQLQPSACQAGEAVAFVVTTFGANISCQAHTFTWNFGDGAAATGLATSHTYVSGGIYAASVVVGSADGQFTVPASITVAGRPFLAAPAPTPALSPAFLALLGVALVIVARIASRSQV
jgi:hypothetical protein